jgi:ketosteroid isomerase-like protein
MSRLGFSTNEKRRGKVPRDDRLQLVRDVYRACASSDRDFVEEAFSDDFTFSTRAFNNDPDDYDDDPDG